MFVKDIQDLKRIDDVCLGKKLLFKTSITRLNKQYAPQEINNSHTQLI